MKIIAQASLLAVALALTVPGTPAVAQISSNFSNSKIAVWENEKGDRGYWTTTFGVSPAKALSPQSKALRDRMISRRVLEEYVEFLSPLRLPHQLKLFASDCSGGSGDSPYYAPTRYYINMCYGFMASAEALADALVEVQAEQQLWTPVSRDQLAAGMFVSLLLHETGHAVFDIMDVPVFGREEDAADQVAGFIALQFGRENARTAIKGFAYFWAGQWNPQTSKPDTGASDYPKDPLQQCLRDPVCAYADVHGTAKQRMYNTLCIAYGGQPEWFKDFVDSGWLPPERAKTCHDEYEQIKFAFGKTVLPFIDQQQMKKVIARTWFQPQERRER